MNIEHGYFIKARRIAESEVAHSPPHVREIWDLFLRESCHKARQIRGLQLRRGQLILRYSEIQEALHWCVGYRKQTYTKSQCSNAIKWLKKREMITTQKTTRGLIVTVCNYNRYQTPANYEGHKGSQSAAAGTPETCPTSNKNGRTEECNGATLADGPPCLMTRKRRKLEGKTLEWFGQFWDAFAYKRGKAEAADAWLGIMGLNQELVDHQIVPAARREAARRPRLRKAGQTPKMAQGWLSGRRWEDEDESQEVDPDDEVDIGRRLNLRRRKRQEGLQ